MVGRDKQQEEELGGTEETRYQNNYCNWGKVTCLEHHGMHLIKKTEKNSS